jgi:hypothetical protein
MKMKVNYQNLWDSVKSVFGGKFITLHPLEKKKDLK